MRGKLSLLIIVLALNLVAVTLLAQPTYSSTHFDVYDKAGAGLAYAQSIANALESGYSSLIGAGASLAPPCSGTKYNVTIVNLSGEGGEVRSSFLYDPSTGRITKACISYILMATGLSGSTLNHIAYHEMVHVAQASYYQYISVVSSYPWYVEANAEGVSSALSGVCGWEPWYFSYSLYTTNPYSYSDGNTQSYAYGAFYYWLIKSGAASVPGTLSGSFSGSTTNSDWVNSNYVSFLLAITKGIGICGKTYYPSYQTATLTGNSWTTSLSLDGLSAAYYKITLPAPGTVAITATGNVKSNLQLSQPFYVSNSSLILAIVNPSTSSITSQVTVTYSPPLIARVVSGVYKPLSGTLTLQLSITYANQPVTGTVTVNGQSVQASNGQATVTFSNVTWGSFHIDVSYWSDTYSFDLALNKPTLSWVTQTPLYLTGNGYGFIVLSINNPSQVSIETNVAAVSPMNGSTPVLAFQNPNMTVTFPPGQSTLQFSFNVNGFVSQGDGYIYLYTGPNDKLSTSFQVKPASISILSASYDTSIDKTNIQVAVQPAGITQSIDIKGTSGSLQVKLSTYTVGTLAFSIPSPNVVLQASPQIVAPLWFTASLQATLTVSGQCPSFPVDYRIQLKVNGTEVGGKVFKCGETASLSNTLNLTRTTADTYTLVANNNPAWATKVRIWLPKIQVSLKKWTVTDNGSNVVLQVSVSGSHRYLVLGRIVSNESFEISYDLPAGNKTLVLDTGFEKREIGMPPVILKVYAPEIVLRPYLVNYSLSINTNATVKARVKILLNGTTIGEALFDAEKNISTVKLSTVPKAPGAYVLRGEAWFARNETIFIYVSINGVKVSADRFRLLGTNTTITAYLFIYPRIPASINLTLAGCGLSTFKKVPANSTISLGFAEPCTLTVKAQVLNYTDQATVYWDVLNLYLAGQLGYMGAEPVIGNGTVRGEAKFSNGTLVPGKVTVNGESEVYVPDTGEKIFQLRVEYMGVSNETTVKAFLVPANLYLEALNISRKLSSSENLAKEISIATVTGRWDKVARAVSLYRELEKGSNLDPLNVLAAKLYEKWSAQGDDSLIGYVEFLNRNKIPIYAGILSAVSGIAYLVVRRRKAKA
ncbi:hypothetical protein [Thermofilum sp.]